MSRSINFSTAFFHTSKLDSLRGKRTRVKSNGKQTKGGRNGWGRSVAKGSMSAGRDVEWLPRLLRSKSACVREKLKFFEMGIAVGDMTTVVNLFGGVDFCIKI